MANVIFDTSKKLMPALDRTSTWSDMNFRASAYRVHNA